MGWVIVVIAPFCVHLALATGRLVAVTGVVASLQVGIVTAVMLRGPRRLRSRQPGSRRWEAGLRAVVPVVAATGMFLACRAAFRSGIVVETGIAHALLYSTLLAVFARSLRRGHTPVAAAAAVRLGGPRSPAVLAYCRSVTKAWCVFFAGQLATSAALLLFAPVSDWSLFVNALDLPCLALMFLGEYACRMWHLRNEEHVPLATLVRSFKAQSGAGQSGAGQSDATRSDATRFDATRPHVF